MRNTFLFAAAILSGAVIFAACNSYRSKMAASNQNAQKTVEPETTYADGARRMTTIEAQALIKKGQAFVVDVRNQASYDSGHIPGAKLIPAETILSHVNELPRDKTIITYCS